ncbi:MAG TPA: hypothetical protein VFF91_02500 [Pseudoxanthomonas sp.]|nr:hypothetical protein [Pseudoxanthomonas sp.]
MNRWKAFAIHLLLSLVLISTISAAALLTWYPYGLYRISGLDRLLLVMLCIDVVAGPLLTLLIYKPGKPGLRFDLKVIAGVQAAFLAYGLNTLWKARPVFLVAADVRFTLIAASEVDPTQLSRAARPEWRSLPWSGPILVGVLPPETPQEREALLTAFISEGRDQEQLPDQYRPYDEVVPLLLRNATPLDGRKAPLVPGKVGLPIYSRDDAAWMVVDPGTGQPQRVVSR